MTAFIFLEEVGELPYTAACVARCTGARVPYSNYKGDISSTHAVNLLERMISNMTEAELWTYRLLYSELEFSKPGKVTT